MVAEFLQGGAEVVMGVGEIRPDGDGLAVSGHRLVEPAQ